MRVSKPGSLNTFADKILYLAHLRFSSNSSIFVALRVSHFFIHIAATRQPIRKNTNIMWLYPLEFNSTLTLTVSLELNVMVVVERDGLFPSPSCTLRSKPHLSITLPVDLLPPGLSTLTPSQAAGVCCRLGAWKLLLVESGRRDLEQRIRLNVNQDDVLYALQSKPRWQETWPYFEWLTSRCSDHIDSWNKFIWNAYWSDLN